MNKSKGIQLGAVFAAMLIVMATIAVPVAVAEANSGTSSGTAQTPGNGCGCSGECGSNITAAQLNGSEASKVIAEVLKNEDFKALRNKLIHMEYTPIRNEALASYAYAGNVDSTEIKMVVVPFDTHFGGNASILWSSTNGNITIRAVISGDAVLTSEPWKILTADDKYKEISENLTSSGYRLNEEAATVFIRPSMIATIIIPIDGKQDAVRGVVELTTGKVISVENGYWECVAGCITKDCLCAYVGIPCPPGLPNICTICLTACTFCAQVPSPYTCIPCGLCLGGEVAKCMYQCY